MIARHLSTSLSENLPPSPRLRGEGLGVRGFRLGRKFPSPATIPLFMWAFGLLVALGCQRQSPDSEANLEALFAPADATSMRSDQRQHNEWAKAVNRRAFRFPHDHGAHIDYRIEWWYYTGNLQTPSGQRFGYQLTFFRTGVQRQPENPSRWAVRDLYTAHFAISDIENREHHFWQRNRRAGIGQAGAKTGRLHVFNGDWSAEMRADTHQLAAGSGEFSIRLKLRPAKSLVLQGDHGLSQKGDLEGNASYYYSFPRLYTTGTITVDGVSHDVRGESWMDHEFSTSLLEEGQLGWDWFSIQLSNNTELTLYQMRCNDGTIDPHSSGAFVAEDGEVTQLDVSDFHLRPMSTWRSNRTGGEYPLRWRITIPKVGIDLNVEPAFGAQEMVTDATTGISYWEGSIDVTGTQKENVIQGKGYLELTGYTGCGLGSLFGN